jgi:hypothetical protein
MSEVSVGGRAYAASGHARVSTASLGAADRLSLAATPICAIMALLTVQAAPRGTSLCASAPDTSRGVG